jgi:hypothetical protein
VGLLAEGLLNLARLLRERSERGQQPAVAELALRNVRGRDAVFEQVRRGVLRLPGRPGAGFFVHHHHGLLLRDDGSGLGVQLTRHHLGGVDPRHGGVVGEGSADGVRRGWKRAVPVAQVAAARAKHRRQAPKAAKGCGVGDVFRQARNQKDLDRVPAEG